MPGTWPTPEPRDWNNEELIYPAGPLQCLGSSRTFSEGQTCFLGRNAVAQSVCQEAALRIPARLLQLRPAPLIHTLPTGRPRPWRPAAPRRHKPPARDRTREPEKTRREWDCVPTTRTGCIAGIPRSPRKPAWQTDTHGAGGHADAHTAPRPAGGAGMPALTGQRQQMAP